MGSCFGKCWCSCCDCVFIKQSGAAIRRSARNKSQTFTLRRQSSTIEFENLIFDIDLPEPSNSVLQLQSRSVSSRIAVKDAKESEERMRNKTKGIVAKNNRFGSELPLMDPLLYRVVEEATSSSFTRTSPPIDRLSTGASSETGEFQWEHDLGNDDVNGTNELEWDHYEEENLVFANNETEHLIQEMDELTKKLQKDSG
ncbi:hypothetical protein B4U80_01230 [Leptotrombidium deliense]|uniref:Uncharacterized protein n=1 Tax=Leptotrombidium deliense TaxID=299467 RepID=A0A443SL21_9ACAR|nr:hypothetical protein B4U80_01230 [Leptotrombidium deliense]